MEGCCGNTSGERGKERSRPRLASIMDACLCLASPSRCPALSTTQPTHNSRCLAACLPARFQGPSPPPGRDGFDWSGTDDGFVADRTVRNPLPPVRVGGDRERQGSRDRWTGIPQYRDRWICRCLGTGLMEQLHYKKKKTGCGVYARWSVSQASPSFDVVTARGVPRKAKPSQVPLPPGLHEA